MKTNYPSGEQIFFHESQRFSQWWLWTLLIAVQCVTLFGVVWGPDSKKNFPEMFVLPALIPLAIMVLLSITRLETKIDPKGISFRWRPYMSRWKTFEWGNIREVFMKEYSWLTGYGIRLSPTHGIVHNTSGHCGIQIVLSNGAKCMLGTQKPEEAGRTLNLLREEKILS